MNIETGYIVAATNCEKFIHVYGRRNEASDMN